MQMTPHTSMHLRCLCNFNGEDKTRGLEIITNITTPLVETSDKEDDIPRTQIIAVSYLKINGVLIRINIFVFTQFRLLPRKKMKACFPPGQLSWHVSLPRLLQTNWNGILPYVNEIKRKLIQDDNINMKMYRSSLL